MLTDAYTALSTLREMLTHQREQRKENIACGSVDATDAKREQQIGECKGLKFAIDKITDQIRSLNSADDPKDPA